MISQNTFAKSSLVTHIEYKLLEIYGRFPSEYTLEVDKTQKYCIDSLIANFEGVNVDAFIWHTALTKTQSKKSGTVTYFIEKHNTYLICNDLQHSETVGFLVETGEIVKSFMQAKSIDLLFDESSRPFIENSIIPAIEKCIFRQQGVQILSLLNSYSGYVPIEYSANGYTPNLTQEYYDAHYGIDFYGDFYLPVLQQMSTTNKGILLLYGGTGTGKTSFIRNIIADLYSKGKTIILESTKFGDELCSPKLIEFLNSNPSTTVSGSVIIIEDAEELIQKGIKNTRNKHVDNILNITDGILNDITNVQIIISTNADIGELDSAIIRPSRLIAARKFINLSICGVDRLNAYTGFSYPVESVPQDGISLARYYASKDDPIVINNGYFISEKSIGFA